jgi:hypothetical protein
MQQHLQEPDEASFMNLDSGVVDRADGEGQGQALQKGEVHVDVQPLRLESGESIRDRQALGTHGFQVVEPFVEAKVAEIV